jgi:lysophospholipase L1-like esterase
MREVARELGVPLVDVTAAFDARGRDGLFLTPRGDPIHPTREGHALIGRLVFEQVRGLLPPGSGARR